ncbi:MAG: hypothetical protein WA628_19040 [Terriglobales bacterium]
MSIPTAVAQAPSAAPAVMSTINVDQLEGSTITAMDKKNNRWFEVGHDSTNTNSPQSKHELGKEAEPTPEAKALITTLLAVGEEWQSKRKTATDYFDGHKVEVLKLRTEFGVRQGTKGKLLYVPQPGGTQRAMYWSEFVTLAFGVSERHINRLLGIPADPKESPDPTKSKNYKLGFVDGQEAALRGQVQAPAEAQPASKLDKEDPYAYFEQLKCEKQTFADELAAMVIDIYDSTDAEEIAKAFDKEMKRQLAEIRKASIKRTKE